MSSNNSYGYDETERAENEKYGERDNIKYGLSSNFTDPNFNPKKSNVRDSSHLKQEYEYDIPDNSNSSSNPDPKKSLQNHDPHRKTTISFSTLCAKTISLETPINAEHRLSIIGGGTHVSNQKYPKIHLGLRKYIDTDHGFFKGVFMEGRAVIGSSDQSNKLDLTEIKSFLNECKSLTDELSAGTNVQRNTTNIGNNVQTNISSVTSTSTSSPLNNVRSSNSVWDSFHLNLALGYKNTNKDFLGGSFQPYFGVKLYPTALSKSHPFLGISFQWNL